MISGDMSIFFSKSVNLKKMSSFGSGFNYKQYFLVGQPHLIKKYAVRS